MTESRRVLVIGAHPDDEDTGLLTLMARGRGAEAAYLSLTRGEGGQNLIGQELGIGLGILRTRELEAARRIDGARQYFTRAYDFGYTRSLEETERFWPPDSVLKDVVRIVRLFRPHVIVSVFSGTPRDGHGQHQMAGVMARRAWEAAGDSTVFPEVLESWTPLKLYQSTRFNRGTTTLRLPLGGIDPRVGKTYRQIASESRSQHRSQDFGSVQQLGPAESHVQLLASRVDADPDTDIFTGIPQDASWLIDFADSLRRSVTPATMHDAVPILAAAYRRWDEENRDDGSLFSPGGALLRAMGIAAGVSIDGRVGVRMLVPGDTVSGSVEIYNAGPFGFGEVMSWFHGRSGSGVLHWRTGTAGVESGTMFTADTVLTVNPDASPTQPYFLECPPLETVYDWTCGQADLGYPMQWPLVAWHSVSMWIDSLPLPISREVTWRRRDQALGEIREPVRVVPRLDVNLTPQRMVWPAGGADERPVMLTVTNNGRDTADAVVSLDLGDWTSPPAVSVEIAPGASRTVEVALRRPGQTARARVTARAVVLHDGQRYDRHVEMVSYPHIRPTQWVRDATSEIVVAPMALPDVGVIGYVRGASDRVPEALAEIGLPLELLGPDSLARGDLSRFEVIVIGPRAYETDTALTAHNERLLAWTRGGGHLLVQYQQYQFVRGTYAPYPLDIGRPHDRITDETAPVTLLAPGHPLFRTPNILGPEDWDGWVQERGLYFPERWADAYTPLLEMQDPDRPPVRGGLLVAHVGEGTYAYTGISFFRELPAGVPGAFRLFLNLLAWDGRDGG